MGFGVWGTMAAREGSAGSRWYHRLLRKRPGETNGPRRELQTAMRRRRESERCVRTRSEDNSPNDWLGVAEGGEKPGVNEKGAEKKARASRGHFLELAEGTAVGSRVAEGVEGAIKAKRRGRTGRRESDGKSRKKAARGGSTPVDRRSCGPKVRERAGEARGEARRETSAELGGASSPVNSYGTEIMQRG
ncbi:hypothetical protein GOBAR_DD33849 [Gossypium barbadense]|nr:hypothetical protein GOBAR_DD33849 [Gossypium barbadense]